MTKPQGVSFSDLLVGKKSEAVECEYVLPDGQQTGIYFSILPDQCAQAREATNALINRRRQAEAAREADALLTRSQPVTPIEEDIQFSQNLAAIRLVGWRGIADVEYTPERALELCRENPDVASFILARSRKLASFTPASPKA